MSTSLIGLVKNCISFIKEATTLTEIYNFINDQSAEKNRIGITKKSELVFDDEKVQLLPVNGSLFYNNYKGSWHVLDKDLESKIIRVSIYQHSDLPNDHFKYLIYSDVEMFVTEVNDGVLSGIIRFDVLNTVKNVKICNVTMFNGLQVTVTGLVGYRNEMTTSTDEEFQKLKTSGLQLREVDSSDVEKNFFYIS